MNRKKNFDEFEERRSGVYEMQSANLGPLRKKASDSDHQKGFLSDMQSGTLSPLRKIRKSRGMTLQELAELSEISASYLSRIEVKERRLNEALIRRLCPVLKCTPGDLLNDVMIPNFEHTNQMINTSFTPDLPLHHLKQENNSFVINTEERKEFKYRPVELLAEDGAFVIKVPNNANLPKYKENDLLYIKPSRPISVDSPVIVVDKNYRITIGCLKHRDGVNTTVVSYDGSVKTSFTIDELECVYCVHMSVEA